MSLRITYLEFARDDLYAAWSWYEDQQRGLGHRFTRAVDSALHQVATWPGSGTPTIEVAGEVVERRVGAMGFPYLIRYRVVDDTILVTAIYHQRRHPDVAADRTRGRRRRSPPVALRAAQTSRRSFDRRETSGLVGHQGLEP